MDRDEEIAGRWIAKWRLAGGDPEAFIIGAMKEYVEGDEGSLIAEDLTELSRDEILALALQWRSYWVQWQDWADRELELLGNEKPDSLFSYGRLGSQLQIGLLVGRALATIARLEGEIELLKKQAANNQPGDAK
jgi:hypothetical protein